MIRIKTQYRVLCSITIVCIILMSNPAFSARKKKTPYIEPKAEKILRQMCDYLKTLEQFTFHTENTIDAIPSVGHKIQLASAVDVYLRRPDRLRADAKGDRRNAKFYYNGKTVTINDDDSNQYATMKAPPEIEEALVRTLKTFNINAPLAVLIHRNPYKILTKKVKTGVYVGLHYVNGIQYHHLMFNQKSLDWQIWIENDDTPLPRKFIITKTVITGAPQFTALMSNWDVSAKLKDSLFNFIPLKKAEEIKVIPASIFVVPWKVE